ncbi:MAG: glutamate 5-kinase [Methylacidiphilales bacterium]|nr:glutamate 5-kinase [Candidatus Methylacidiphilales bacterium]MDW8349463.1 glutamate 5-kinase [Verrucomicrobiae bacterium]
MSRTTRLPKTWVIKLGTGILSLPNGQLDLDQIHTLSRQIAILKRSMRIHPILVTSGAIGAGMTTLNLKKRPTIIEQLQSCAAIGQPLLMHHYETAFRTHNLHIAQILLTYLDLDSRQLYTNTRKTLLYLLSLPNIIPIINENDVVSYEEIKFGDNDRLSAHVAAMIPADLLVLLTTVDGLYSKPNGTGQLIRRLTQITPKVEAMAGNTPHTRSVGGMTTKLLAARIAQEAGIPTRIANGRTPDVLIQLARGRSIGTLIQSTTKTSSNKSSP